MHYKRWAAHGDPLVTLKVGRKPNTRQGALLFFDRGPGCWEWQGTLTDEGYGQFALEHAALRAHRLVYELLVGPIPSGLDLDHECHNKAAARGECAGGATCPHRRCVNPTHLVPRTPGANAAASPLVTSSMNAAKTHCPRNHPLFGPNLYRKPDGRRVCRTCKTAAQRARRAAK